MNIIDQVPSEAKCRGIVRKALFGERVFCPHCQTSHVKKLESRYWCPYCRKKFSLTSATWLKAKKISYRKIFLLLVCWQQKVAFRSMLQFSGLSAPTVRRYIKIFRKNLVYESPKLSGTIEVDEAWLGRKRHRNQTIVIGGTNRFTDDTVVRIMKHRDQEWSDRFLLEHVTPENSFVYHDGWEGYHGIDNFFGYAHQSCIHDIGDFGPTNHIENIWSRLKRFITRTWDHSWKKHLPEILREFEARINTPQLFKNPLNYLEICLTIVPTAC